MKTKENAKQEEPKKSVEQKKEAEKPKQEEPNKMAEQKAPEKQKQEQKAQQHAAHHPAHPARKKGLFHTYLQSWKQVKTAKYPLIVMYDLIFYVLLFPLFYGYGYFINMLVKPFKDLDTSALTSKTAEQLGLYQQSLSGVIVFVFLISIVFSLLFVLIWSLSRAFMWTKLLDKKLTGKYIGKFYLLNMIWMLLVSVLFIIASVVFYSVASASAVGGIVVGIIMALLLVIVVYFMYILYYKFSHELKIFRSLLDMIVLGVTKLPRLILPLLLVVCTLAVVTALSYVLKLLPQIAMEIISYLLFFGIFGWVKLYAADVLKEKI